jgi:membrane protein DedA with SNARE-associated domain
MVAQGRLTFGPALLGCSLGIFLGDIGLFLAGRWLGRPVVARAPLRWFLSPESLDRASAWFVHRGPRAIFLSRFMPGLRLPTYFAAGVLRTSLPRFMLYFLLAVLAWTPVLVGGALVFGHQALELFDTWGATALVAVLVGLLLLERVVVRLFTFRGRRQLVGAWRRWTHWEFWPPQLFYAPIIVYVGWLALRHRSLVGVTAVNPGIPTGGLIGESKSQILDSLDSSTGFLTPYLMLRTSTSAEARERAALAFAQGEGGGYPIVLKPDVGQRGSGVTIVRSGEELAALARGLEIDHMLQRYVPGEEFGLFYLRESGAKRGRIFSITSKVMPEVVGDGVHTLEQLILMGERSVAAAVHYLRAQSQRLEEVLAPGERLQLVEIGTHCRGAIFLDGDQLRTPELEAQIERLARSFEGFHFGRFDVRAPSAAALSAGEGFQVLELNGMTAEATHIYDPAHGIFFAYRVLFEQWRLAFEIASANRRAGARPSTWSEVLTELFGYRSKQRHHGAKGPPQSS